MHFRNRKLFAALLAFVITVFILSAPLCAAREIPVFHHGDTVQAGSTGRPLSWGDGLLQGKSSTDSSRFGERGASRSISNGSENFRRVFIACLLFLLYACCLALRQIRCWRALAPPPLVQPYALLRFQKRSDGRKRFFFANQEAVCKI